MAPARPPIPYDFLPPLPSLTVTSDDIADGKPMPDAHLADIMGMTGDNLSPHLRWEGAPAETKSLALIVDDPDAPVGLFTHWLVWNIDPKTTEIAEGSVPNGGVQGTNDFPGQRYDGPQPPSGTHRYYFKMFALDQMLDLKAGAKRKEVNAAMKGHVLAHGELMGRYSKQ